MDTKMHLNVLSLRSPFLMDDQAGLLSDRCEVTCYISDSAVPSRERLGGGRGGRVGGAGGLWHDPVQQPGCVVTQTL